MRTEFFCARCRADVVYEKPGDSGAAGYGTRPDGSKVCYPCCAAELREEMAAAVDELRCGGKPKPFILYLVGKPGEERVTDWAGGLSYRVTGRRSSWHNMGGRGGRVDFWFRDEAGNEWWGKLIGDMQAARCRPMRAGLARLTYPPECLTWHVRGLLDADAPGPILADAVDEAGAPAVFGRMLRCDQTTMPGRRAVREAESAIARAALTADRPATVCT